MCTIPEIFGAVVGHKIICMTKILGIKKYGSTSYLSIGQVLKWPPIHNVQKQLPEKNEAEELKMHFVVPQKVLFSCIAFHFSTRLKCPMVFSSFKHEVTNTTDRQVSNLMFKNIRLLTNQAYTSLQLITTSMNIIHCML